MSGIYDRRFLTGVTIEARIPQMPLFQGKKIPKFCRGNRNEKISLPLSHNSMKLSVGETSFEHHNNNDQLYQGESVRIYIYKNNVISRSLFPTILSFKSIIFIIILIFPVLGTCLSLVLADKSTMIVFK